MTGLLGIGVLVMIAADAIVGLRLLGLARRTRRLPELAIGASLLLLGGVGYPLTILARNGVGGPEGSEWLLGAGFLFENVASAAMALATWRTFRPDARWARALFAALAAALGSSWVAQAIAGDFAPGAAPSPLYWLAFAGRALPFAWSAAESWHYHAKLQKRLALGLADPVVTDRFRLWALNTTSVSIAFAIFGVAVAQGIPVSSSPGVLASSSIVGLISGVSMWLAFLPPEWYLRRFEGAGAAVAA